MKIEGSVALVTGSNRGIGRAIVEALHAAKAARIYVTARDIEKVADLCARDPERLIPIELDIRDGAQIERAASIANDVDLLINNAGVNTYSGLLAAPTLDGARLEIETNYFGTLGMCRAFAPVLKKRGGTVVNLASVAGRVSFPAIGTLAASKAAVISLCQGVRAELRAAGVHVVTVMPAVVDTDMTRGWPGAKTPPAEVAAAILRAVEDGTEDLYPDAMAAGLAAGLAHDPKAVERECGGYLPQ